MKTIKVPFRLASLFPGVIAALALWLPSAWGQSGPAITRQPLSQTNAPGANVALTVAVSGTGPFSYQWRFDGTNLPAGLISTAAGGGVGDGAAAAKAGLNNPTGLAVDASGNLFIADFGNNRVRKVDPNGIITTVAGNGAAAYAGDGGPAANASLSAPEGVAVDASGNLFIADRGNNVVRKVGLNGIITTVAGNGFPGYTGDGGPAAKATLINPAGVAVDASGNLFIADSGNNLIRKVDANLVITTVAGNGSPQFLGDGGPATNASLFAPEGVALDPSGNLFIADTFNGAIRKVDLNGVISTVAGNGTQGFSGDGAAATNAALSNPEGVAVDASGRLVIADTGNDALRRVDLQGIITTVAGDGTNGFSGDGGAAGKAVLSSPGGVAADSAGRLYIADSGNHVIREVDVNGIINTVAGDGAANFSGDGGPAVNASLASPEGMAEDASGRLFIADTGNNVVRLVGVNGVITTAAGNGSEAFSGDGGTATNASLSAPSAVAVDTLGNLFIADTGNQRVRKVTPGGVITTFAGGGAGIPGDGGPATDATLSSPTGVAVDGAGNVYIAEFWNFRIRQVGVNGIITTVAGNGSAAYSGDGGPATNASLNNPAGVTVDGAGNLFIADYQNNVIRKVDLNGVITTVAGNGSAGYSGDGGPAADASLLGPYAVALDPSGNLLFSDSGNDRVREFSTAGLPTLTLENVTVSNAGSYQVIITGPSGSVTSAVATLTVQSPTGNRGLLMSVPVVSGSNLLLSFTPAPPSGVSLTLLQAQSLTGPWTTNTTAILTTNAQSNGGQFSLPKPASTQFYQLRSP